ncbi:MAG: hypothetical protein IKT14_02395 [Clostridiales bacterium]|nr:hypothetical protein [Clostridiales bacterium]
MDNNKKANKLCLISLGLSFGLPLIFGIVCAALKAFGMDEESVLTVTTVGSIALCPAEIAGLILMIVVRAKYPSNKFGKVLMIIYIVVMVLGVLAVIYMIGSCFKSCQNGMW